MSNQIKKLRTDTKNKAKKIKSKNFKRFNIIAKRKNML